jgi:predicted nucleic acid-binding protein
MAGLPVAPGVIDTPILVDYRAGEPNAMAFIAAIRLHRQPEFSQISALVLLSCALDQIEHNGVRLFLSISTVHSITAQIARRSQAILHFITPPSPLTSDDAIVAATAIEHKLPLYTLDPPRFAGVARLTVLQPY